MLGALLVHAQVVCIVLVNGSNTQLVQTLVYSRLLTNGGEEEGCSVLCACQFKAWLVWVSIGLLLPAVVCAALVQLVDVHLRVAGGQVCAGCYDQRAPG